MSGEKRSVTQTSRPTGERDAPAPPCTLVIFGATGDLTKRLLMPALYNLARWGLLPEPISLLCTSRTEVSSEEFQAKLADDVKGILAAKGGEASAGGVDAKAWERVGSRITYLPGDITDPAFFEALKGRIAEVRPGGGDGPGNVLFYLAIAAKLFGPTVENLAKAGLLEETDEAWRRVIIEKPFGADLPSAQALNRQILSVAKESQIFRIDHFLGKETVQNIMAFRFGNGFFEPIWNRDHIDHVQITVSETVGVEARGSFYETTGALRDMVPNHLFQLLTMTAMEPPVSFAADDVRGKKQDVLSALRAVAPEDAVRGQYAAGRVGDKAVKDYVAEADVAPDSQTETYVALRLLIDNWRWAGVPFYLRTGKAMAARDTEIAIQFKQAPLALFHGAHIEGQVPNWLVLQLQPNEGISLQFGAKRPGPAVRVEPVAMRFRYDDYFEPQASTGYETLIYDAMLGEATLFQRADNIEGGWAAVQPILDAWGEGEAPMARYPAGSAGPSEADDLLARDGHAWRSIGN